MTAVDEIASEPHGQKIAIVLGLDQNRKDIVSINYVQVKYFGDRLEIKLDQFLQK
jgi:hypothetical protein